MGGGEDGAPSSSRVEDVARCRLLLEKERIIVNYFPVVGVSAPIHTRLSVDPGAMLEWMGACKKQTTLPADTTASHNKAACFAFAAFPCAWAVSLLSVR